MKALGILQTTAVNCEIDLRVDGSYTTMIAAMDTVGLSQSRQLTRYYVIARNIQKQNSISIGKLFDLNFLCRVSAHKFNFKKNFF